MNYHVLNYYIFLPGYCPGGGNFKGGGYFPYSFSKSLKRRLILMGRLLSSGRLLSRLYGISTQRNVINKTVTNETGYEVAFTLNEAQSVKVTKSPGFL